MNSVFRRSIATFLAVILVLPHPAWALRELQEDRAVPSLERRLRSSAGLEELLTPSEIDIILNQPLEREYGNVLRLTGEVDLARLFGVGTLHTSGRIAALPPELVRDKNILVVPGYGNLPFLLKTLGARKVVGIDIDPVTVAWQKARTLYGRDPTVAAQLNEFIDPPFNPAMKNLPADHIRDLVRQQKQGLSLDGLSFAQASVLGRLPAADASFDLVVVPYLFGMPHGIAGEENFEAAFQELRRVVQPSGTIVVFPSDIVEPDVEADPGIRFFSRWLSEKNDDFSIAHSPTIELDNYYGYIVQGHYALIPGENLRPTKIAAGLEEKTDVRVLYKSLDISFEELLAVSRKQAVRTYVVYKDKDMRDPTTIRFGHPGNPPPPWDTTDLLERDLLSMFGEWARDMRYYVLITEHPNLVGKVWAEVVPVEPLAGLEERPEPLLWIDRFKDAAKALERKGWLRADGFLQPFLQTAQDAQHRGQLPFRQKPSRRLLEILPLFSSFLESLVPDPAKSPARKVFYTARRQNQGHSSDYRKITIEFPGKDGRPVRATLVFHKDKRYPLIAVTLFKPSNSPGVFGPAGSLRLGKDLFGNLPVHLDISPEVFLEGAQRANPAQRAQPLVSHADLVPAWSDKNDPEEALQNFRAFQAELERYLQALPRPSGLEEETDWTLHWDSGYATAEGPDLQGPERELWRNFFGTLRAVTPGARVLETGSGNLAVSRLAQEVSTGFDLHAIDRAEIHPEQILGGDRVQFRKTWMERSGYPAGFFDAVTGRYALEYTATDRSFPELSRILKPGGSGFFLLHHADSNFVRVARQVTVDKPVLPTALEAYEAVDAYLRNRSAENSRHLVEVTARLRAFLDDDDPRVRSEAKTAYQNVHLLVDLPSDEFQAPLEIIGNHIREARFLVGAHHDLVKAALSSQDIADWSHRLTEAGLAIDRFEPFYRDAIPAGWILELHKPLSRAGLEETLDLTSEILGSHPFEVRAFSGPETARRQLFLYDPAQGAFLDTGGIRTPSLGMQRRMILDKASESLLRRTLEAGIPVPPWELMSLIGTPNDEEFAREILRLIPDRFYAGKKTAAMKVILQLRAQPTADLLSMTTKVRPAVEPLVLLALLYKLRGYGQEAYSINAVQSLQLAMHFLANNGDYEALIQSVNQALKNPFENPRRSSQPGIRNVSEIESVHLWQIKEGTATLVSRVEVKLKGRPEPVFFALNVAKDATAATEAVAAAFSTLESYYRIDPTRVMEPYFHAELGLTLGEGERQSKKTIGVFSGEWVEGDEIHLDIQPDGLPDMRIWTHQKSPGEPLSGQQMDQVWEEMARMQARYSSLVWADGGTVLFVQPAFIALNAGDLVWARKPDGVFGPILIWPWSASYDQPIEAADFLVRSLLVSAVDQNTSAPVRQSFWGQPERALEITRDEFSKKAQTAVGEAGLSADEQAVFVRAYWRATVRDAVGKVIPRFSKDPGLFLQSWFFNPAEQQQAVSHLAEIQALLQNHLASLSEEAFEPSAGLEEPISRRAVLQRFVAGLVSANLDLERLARPVPNGPSVSRVVPLEKIPTAISSAAAESSKKTAQRLIGTDQVDVSGFLADVEINAPYFHSRSTRSTWAQETPSLARATQIKEERELEAVSKLAGAVAQKSSDLVQQLKDPDRRVGLLDSVRSAEPAAFQGLPDDQLAGLVSSAVREEAGQIQTLVQAWIPRAQEMLAALSDGLVNASTAVDLNPDLPNPPAEPAKISSGADFTDPINPLPPQLSQPSEFSTKRADEQIQKTVVRLLEIPPLAVPGSVGSAALVFRDPATFDLAALAVRYGWSVAVLDDSMEAAALKTLLDALPGPKGLYAVGIFESKRFLEEYEGQISIDDRPEGFRVLGLRWDDLPPPVSAALESVLAYLDRATSA